MTEIKKNRREIWGRDFPPPSLNPTLLRSGAGQNDK